MEEVRNGYNVLEGRVYDSDGSDEARATARIDLANRFPERALSVFIKHGDEEGLEYLSRNPNVPVQVRRNAYIERGMHYEAEQLIVPERESVAIADPSPDRKPREMYSKQKLEAMAKEEAKRDAEKRQNSYEAKVARQFRAEHGVSEEEFQEELANARKWFPSLPSVNRTGEEMGPWQETAYRKGYEGD